MFVFCDSPDRVEGDRAKISEAHNRSRVHWLIFGKMMEEDLKLAQAMARMHTNREANTGMRSSSPAAGSGRNSPAPDPSAGDDPNIKTHASMVLEKIQGFR